MAQGVSVRERVGEPAWAQRTRGSPAPFPQAQAPSEGEGRCFLACGKPRPGMGPVPHPPAASPLEP